MGEGAQSFSFLHQSVDMMLGTVLTVRNFKHTCHTKQCLLGVPVRHHLQEKRGDQSVSSRDDRPKKKKKPTTNNKKTQKVHAGVISDIQRSLDDLIKSYIRLDEKIN